MRWGGTHCRLSTTDGSEDIENEEEAGTSDDVDLVIHCAMGGFHEYRKIWSPKFGQTLNATR